MSGQAKVQEGASPVEHVEDCPAERGDCTCGGYVPLSVSETLWREIHRYHRAIVPFGQCQMCIKDAERLGLDLPKPADLRKEETT